MKPYFYETKYYLIVYLLTIPQNTYKIEIRVVILYW